MLTASYDKTARCDTKIGASLTILSPGQNAEDVLPRRYRGRPVATAASRIDRLGELQLWGLGGAVGLTGRSLAWTDHGGVRTTLFWMDGTGWPGRSSSSATL